MRKREWIGAGGDIGAFVRRETKNTLSSYRAQPNLVDEQANQEQDTARGGYAQRQIIELIQNSADQLAKSGRGRIDIRLTHTHLYCADNGAPLDRDGAKALLFSHLSPKRDTAEIGRFGVGFKSVLGVTDSPAIFSRSGSLQFDRERAAEQIRSAAPRAANVPVLRVADPIDPHHAAAGDPTLAALMDWAANVVRLPLKSDAYTNLAEQIQQFQPEFLLFVPHVEQLDMQADQSSRALRLSEADGKFALSDNGQSSRWKVFQREHRLSAAAQEDSRTLDNAETVQIWWAAPLDPRNAAQQFWAYFPTQTSSLVSGILNAPWKTNEDRQSLLPGIYNAELIAAAAALIAEALPELSEPRAPARHLDFLPRREEAGDNNHAKRLRRELYKRLQDAPVIPDQNGALHRLETIKLPPNALTPGQEIESEAIERWCAYEHRPADWLHADALSSERLAAIGRIYVGGETARGNPPRALLSEWLTALVRHSGARGDAVQASMAAVQTAAMVPECSRRYVDLGAIVLTAAGGWAAPDPDSIYLDGGEPAESVHPDLAMDATTANALRTLGLQTPSPESAFRKIAAALLRPAYSREAAGADERWEEFWRRAREVDRDDAERTIRSRPGEAAHLHVLTAAGQWRLLSDCLLPGGIVPLDGSRDARIVIDTEFHADDRVLLGRLGAADGPHSGHWTFDFERQGPLHDYSWACIDQYYYQQELPRRPQYHYPPRGDSYSSGPLTMFPELSPEGRVRFSEVLLELETTYHQWTMWHETKDRIYPTLSVESPAVYLLRKYGRVRTPDGIHALADGLGEKPTNREVQRWLLEHPKTRLIRAAFPDLQSSYGGIIEPIGEDQPVPLLDAWPGLARAVTPEQETLDLTRCDRLADEYGAGLPFDCVRRGGTLFMNRMDDEAAELRAVVRTLELDIGRAEFRKILLRATPADVERAREQVRSQTTDAERLLAAVGETALRARLPGPLTAILQEEARPFSGVRVAEAAIATFHTGALREYRHAIEHLDPPQQWAGRKRAQNFVESLGFSAEWAGQSSPKREPFFDVPGPRSLPDLHDYQRRAGDAVKAMLAHNGRAGENRGLLSLPTGSGKTRVAVQAIIEAMRGGGFKGTVLWVADRDELCEQAAEAWQQAWASIGVETKPLRISRWWGGQQNPQTVDSAHVIIASIQTLDARSGPLADIGNKIGLLVVDEAHGSIAPSYTRLLSELRLTSRRREDEINLLGLTATPYRGRDEAETERLVNRYGARRLDAAAFDGGDPQDVVAQLQEMTVLARVDHDVIPGMHVSLRPEEARQIRERNLPWLPDSVERRIAQSAERTRSIVEAYLSRVRGALGDAPTLIFATSVEHARTVAAMLELSGVPARAVSGETDPAVRRSVVEQFRSGGLQVLVNYGVFREGFDAPKTRAILVARPVYSPNLYFQMIGRGLRGVLNGGTDRCLIIDVEDNVEHFDRKLAFTELEGLWD